MEEKPQRLDAGRAWTDAMALLNGQREILLTLTGFFIMLPALLLNTLRPFVGTGEGLALARQMIAWSNANIHWIALVAILAALGRLSMLILLIDPARPTVRDALAAGGRLLILFVAMDLLIGLMLMGGFLLFILPCLYIFGRTFLAEAAFVSDRARSPIAGITRGLELSHGNGWRILGMAAIIYIAGVILSAAIGSVIGVVGALAGGSGVAAFLNGFVDAVCGAGVSLLFVLISVAMLGQLRQQRHMRRRVAG